MTAGRGKGTGLAAAALLVAALVGLAAILGIGPFGGTSPDEFADAADELCEDAHERFAELQRTAPRTPAEAEELARALAGIARDELDAVRGLDAPEELEPRLERYLAAREEGIALLEEGAEAAADGELGRYEELQGRLAAGQPERRELARALGMTVCSRPLEQAADVG